MYVFRGEKLHWILKLPV